MSITVWLGAHTLDWPEGGGIFWAYLNWALSLRSLGARVVWLEAVDPATSPDEVRAAYRTLERNLEPCGLAGAIALCSRTGDDIAPDLVEGAVPIEEARQADLLLNISYDAYRHVMPLFRRTALLDIDPGLTEIWMSEGAMDVAEHDVYFTLGERNGDSVYPDGGLHWHETRPCVALDWWPDTAPPDDAPFTTVSNWDNPEWVTHGEASYDNSKRAGFLPFLDLPSMTGQSLELALCLEADEQLRLFRWQERERSMLTKRGWGVVHSYTVASTPWEYQRYIQRSRGEFSCAKPSYSRLQTAWVSDRTVCYLASGRPAVVQHTGPSDFLPDRCGLFRFEDLGQATACLEAAGGDYEAQGRLARALAEEHFCGREVAKGVLERALA